MTSSWCACSWGGGHCIDCIGDPCVRTHGIQVTQPLGIRDTSPMFPAHPWSEDWMTQHCNRRFGVTPRFEHLRDTMGLADITKWPQPARVIFSNGIQDVSRHGLSWGREGSPFARVSSTSCTHTLPVLDGD